MDLTSIFTAGLDAFRKMQEESGMEENKYLLMLIEMVSGQKPGHGIWEKIE